MTDKDYTVFNKKRLAELKEAYEKCEGGTFIFDEMEMDKTYAKYLIKHLEHEFGVKPDDADK